MISKMRQRGTARRGMKTMRGLPAWAAVLAAVAAMSSLAGAEEPTAAQAGFDAYVRRVEMRLAQERGQAGMILAPVDWQRVRAGEVVVEELTPKGEAELPGALIHDWRGTAFVPGATAEDFERVLRDFADYPKIFAPQVESAQVLASDADQAQVTMRVKQRGARYDVCDHVCAGGCGQRREMGNDRFAQHTGEGDWRGWAGAERG
jgi:hypothetical protein